MGKIAQIFQNGGNLKTHSTSQNVIIFLNQPHQKQAGKNLHGFNNLSFFVINL